MSDDLERTLTEALDRHARRLGPRPDGHLAGVWSHLDRRRNRRRGVAAVGSVVAVGAGVAGLALIGPGEPTAPSAGDGAPVTTLNGVAWRCTDFYAEDLTYRYYRSCTPVADVPAFDVLATMVPVTMLPATAVPTTEGPANTDPFVSVATTIPFVTVPPFATTAPPLTELTTIVTWPDLVPTTTAPGDRIDSVPGSPTTAQTAPTTSIVGGAGTPGGVCQDLSGDAPVTVPCPTDAPVAVIGPADVLPAAQTAFRCNGLFWVDAGAEYLAVCETIGPDGAVEPQTAFPPGTVPASTAPATVAGTAAPENTVAPPLTAPPLTTAPRNVHVIGPGESPALVARLYGITVEELDAANDPAVMDTFIVGDTLVIPAGAAPATAPPLAVSEIEQTYTVMPGDSISLIASRFGVDMNDLVRYNEWDDGLSHILRVGDIVRIQPYALVPPESP